MIVTEELKNELNQAALATTQAYAACPPLGPSKCIKSNNYFDGLLLESIFFFLNLRLSL